MISLFAAREAAAVPIVATNLDTWISSGSAGVALGPTSSDDFVSISGSSIGQLDNTVYFNQTTGLYTYVHQVSPAVIQNISEFSTGFAVNEFEGIAGYSFAQSQAASGAGAGDFDIEWESDGTIDWETVFGGTDGWDSPELMTFFFVSAKPPSSTLRNYNMINGTIGTAQSLAPVPEPGSIALVGSGLVGLYAAVRRRRNLKA